MKSSNFAQRRGGTRCPVCHKVRRGSGCNCDPEATQAVTLNKSASASALKSNPSVHRDELLGRVLDNKYKLIRRLGSGGMGTVYLAHRLRIGDKVAVKVMNSQGLESDLSVKRFRREPMLTARPHDPRIVRIYDSGETADGIVYLVMEYIEAPNMRTVLEREGRFAPERALRLMIEICGGVDAAHRQGIVHRDLKPENIMIIPAAGELNHESVVIVDFGIAKPLDITPEQVITARDTFLGTYIYTSPEQLRGLDIDPRADIYSLGVLFYEMLTGTTPFFAMSIAEIIAKHILDAPPPFPATLKIRHSVEKIIMRALAKEPDERYSSAGEMGQALRATIQTTTATARRRRWQDVLAYFGLL